MKWDVQAVYIIFQPKVLFQLMYTECQQLFWFCIAFLNGFCCKALKK